MKNSQKIMCWELMILNDTNNNNNISHIISAAWKELFRKRFEKMKCKFQSGKTKSKISLAVRIESNSMLSACLDNGFCSRSHNIRLNGYSRIPIFQTSVCSSLRRRLHRRSVSSYQCWRFCASWWIWVLGRLSSLSIVGTMVSVHTVRGRPTRPDILSTSVYY